MAQARADVPIHELITRRWSPYAFADRSIPTEDLRALFEAARWAPSCYNEQPWSYLVAKREETEPFERLLSCLVDANQAWARAVSALALGLARRTFARNGRPNTHARHDLGLASANLSLEATARGICVHQMAGIVPDRARERCGLPEAWEAVTALAIGYPASPEQAPEAWRERDRRRRGRRPVQEFVFGDTWGAPGPA